MAVLGGVAFFYERSTPVGLLMFSRRLPSLQTAAERGGNTLHGSTDCRTQNGPSQGQNLALTGLFVPTLPGLAYLFQGTKIPVQSI